MFWHKHSNHFDKVTLIGRLVHCWFLKFSQWKYLCFLSFCCLITSCWWQSCNSFELFSRVKLRSLRHIWIWLFNHRSTIDRLSCRFELRNCCCLCHFVSRKFTLATWNWGGLVFFEIRFFLLCYSILFKSLYSYLSSLLIIKFFALSRVFTLF